MIEERFWAKVDRRGENECWIWLAGLNDGGYGRFWEGRRSATPAHRYAYELLVGPIPEGLCIDHLCRNRACVNPAHMEPVTMRENILRGDTVTGRNAAKTHCKHGHEFTPENTRIRRNGSRYCRICQRAGFARRRRAVR